MKNIIILMVLFIMLSSCEKEFKIEVPDASKKIVVNAIFDNKKPIAASVTRSISPYGKIIISDLKGASVKLYENENFVEELIYSKLPAENNGKFIGTEIPKVGEIYSIEVNENDLGKIRAVSIIPDSVNIIFESVKKVRHGEWVDELNSYRYNFSFTFEDAPKEDFYFFTMAIPVYRRDTITNTKEFYTFQYAEILTGSLAEQQLYIKNGILFNDLAFDGSKITISGTAMTYSHPFGDYIRNLDDFEAFEKDLLSLDTSHLYISLHHLSKELYNFSSSHALRLKNRNNIYAEPSPIYSNVENGFGVFGGENVTLKKVLIE